MNEEINTKKIIVLSVISLILNNYTNYFIIILK